MRSRRNRSDVERDVALTSGSCRQLSVNFGACPPPSLSERTVVLNQRQVMQTASKLETPFGFFFFI